MKHFFIVFLLFVGMAMESVIANNLDVIFRKNSILSGIKIPDLEYQTPKIKIHSLSKYETLYVYEDSSLPIVNLLIFIEGGALQEPNDLRGLYSIFLELWQTGGANLKSGEKISEELANYGAEVSFSLNPNHILISLLCLKQNFLPSFEVLKEILLYPEFSEEKLNTIKLKFIDSIERRNDRPEKIASRKILELLEYPDLPLESVSKEQIQKINRELILKTYREVLSSRRLHISIDGDIQNLPYFERLSELTKQLGEIKKPYIVKEQKLKQKGLSKLKNHIVLVEKKIPQSVIVLGTLLPPYKSNEIYPLMLGNYILGGGSFVSKFMREVRVNRGLAYYSYSSTRFYTHWGYFLGVSGTNSDQAKETLKIKLDIIRNFSKLLTEQEIQIAKDAIINSFIFEYNNPSRVLYMEILNRINDLPENFMEVFPKKIQNVDKTNLLDTFKKYINSNDLWIVVVGPKTMEETFRDFGLPIKVVDPEAKLDKF